MIAWLAWVMSGQASAQQACIHPMSRIQLGAAIGEVKEALEASELVDARLQLTAISERIPCLDQVVDRDLFALFARYNATVYFYGQDEDQAFRWGVASRLADPDLPWDERLYPESHPVRQMIEGASIPPLSTLPGKALAPPGGGGIFANGRFWARPEAPADGPVLIQIFDRGQRKVDSFWIEGPALPSDWTTVRIGDAAPPSWWGDDRDVAARPAPSPVVPRPAHPAPRPTDPAPRPKDPARQPFPVGPVVASLVLAGLGGGTYLLADSVASTLPEQQTADDLTAVRSRANLLVLASGVSLAGAVGVGVGGVLMSGGGVTVRF